MPPSQLRFANAASWIRDGIPIRKKLAQRPSFALERLKDEAVEQLATGLAWQAGGVAPGLVSSASW